MQKAQDGDQTVGHIGLGEFFLWGQGLHHFVRQIGELEKLIASVTNIARKIEIMFLSMDIIGLSIFCSNFKWFAEVYGKDTIVVKLEQNGVFMMIGHFLTQGQLGSGNSQELSFGDLFASTVYKCVVNLFQGRLLGVIDMDVGR